MFKRIGVAVAVLAGGVFLSGASMAATQIDLLWNTSGNAATTLTTGFSGNLQLNVFLTNTGGTNDLSSLLVAVDWSNSSGLGSPAISGRPASWLGGASVPPPAGMMNVIWASSPFGAGPVLPCAAGTTCEGDFGGLGVSGQSTIGLPDGTYHIGTIIWSVTAGQLAAGTWGLGTFFSTTGGAFNTDGSDMTGLIAGIGAGIGTLNVGIVPEPTTASLMALGLLGLVVAGRSKKA